MEETIMVEWIDAALEKYREFYGNNPDGYNFGEDQLNSLGYRLLEQNKFSEAIMIFELNVEIYPDYANGYDSLGDGYLAADDKQKARKAWEKAVKLGFESSGEKIEKLKM